MSSICISLIISTLLTWGVGLSIPLILRFLVFKKPVGKITAVGIVFLNWFFDLCFFIAIGSESKTHGALFLVALVSYGILRGKDGVNKVLKKKDNEESKPQPFLENVKPIGSPEEYEDSIYKSLRSLKEGHNNNDLEKMIIKKIKRDSIANNNSYYSEDWQIHYAKERIMDKLK